MNEREYINATNLAKIRAAKAVLRDALPMTPKEKGLLGNATEALSKWEDELAASVKTAE